MDKAKGFTLIELIAVLAIVAVLAVVAIPRFIDLSMAAKQSTVEALAGNLGSASALNLATYLARRSNSGSFGVSPIFTNSCGSSDNVLLDDLPAGYSVVRSGSGDETVAHLDSIECDVVDDTDNSIRASFTLYGINPTFL